MIRFSHVKLREVRNLQGYSKAKVVRALVKAVAAAPGLKPSRQLYDNWEKGLSIPTSPYLLNLPEALDCNLTDLIETYRPPAGL